MTSQSSPYIEDFDEIVDEIFMGSGPPDRKR